MKTKPDNGAAGGAPGQEQGPGPASSPSHLPPQFPRLHTGLLKFTPSGSRGHRERKQKRQKAENVLETVDVPGRGRGKRAGGRSQLSLPPSGSFPRPPGLGSDVTSSETPALTTLSEYRWPPPCPTHPPSHSPFLCPRLFSPTSLDTIEYRVSAHLFICLLV